MDQNTSHDTFSFRISAGWSALTTIQKRLIFFTIFLAILLVCLICLTIFLIIHKNSRLVQCTQERLQTPMIKKNGLPKQKAYWDTVKDTSTKMNKEFTMAKKYVVSLHYQHTDGRDIAYCVGSILSPYWLITSSLCVHKKLKMQNIYARSGSIYHNKGGSIHPLTNFLIPDWRNGSTDYYTYRYISAAKVAVPFDISNKLISYVTLPKPYLDERFLPKYKLYTFGWGTYISTEVNPKYEKLQAMTSEIYNPAVFCKSYLQWDELKALQIIENVLCAGDLKAPSIDQCNIDAGAPLTHFGVINGVSWSGVSCKNYPTVYTKVSLFVNWILNVTNTTNL